MNSNFCCQSSAFNPYNRLQRYSRIFQLKYIHKIQLYE